MSEPSAIFGRFLDELSLLVSALQEHIERREYAELIEDLDAAEGALAEIHRLAGAMSELAEAFTALDIAALGHALARASANRMAQGPSTPLPFIGVRDALAYVRWRIAHAREREDVGVVPGRLQGLLGAVLASLAVAAGERVSGADELLIGGDANADHNLDALTTDEQELVRSFGSLDLSAPPDPVELNHDLAVRGNDTTQPGVERDDIPLDMQRLFISETENDLRDLSALITSYGHDAGPQSHLTAMAEIAHKIHGAAAMMGFPELARAARYMQRTAVACKNDLTTPHSAIELAMGRFLVLLESCLAAAERQEAPPPVAQVAGQLYLAAARRHPLPVSARDQLIPSATRTGDMSSARLSQGADATLRVSSHRLDELMILVSALAMNRGSLAGAHARVTGAHREMTETIERLRRNSVRIEDAYSLLRHQSTVSVSEPNGRAPTAGVALHAPGDERLPRQRLGARDSDSQGRDGLDIAVRTLPEAVADVETHSAALASALMQMGQLVEAQETVISNLQHGATRMRLAPLADFAPSLEIHARLLAQHRGKRVRFTIAGEMIEIDRTLIRALDEPLNQLVRNAIVHGIEPPEERAAAGKDETGTLWIRAYYAGSDVVIEVGDDGRGVNTQALLARAKDEGLINPADENLLTREDVLRLAFEPGMTSLDRADALGGSGIGLAEVATLVRGLNGDIVIADSSLNGTIFRISMPMSLTVLQSIAVQAGGQTFSAPFSAMTATLEGAAPMLRRMVSSQESDSSDGSAARLTTYALVATPEMAARWRGVAADHAPATESVEIPAYSLSECLGVASEQAHDAALIVTRHGRHVALLVDSFGVMAETMVRPLPPMLRRSLIRGVTIRAEDGSIALLVDVAALADQLLAGTAKAPAPLPTHSRRVEPGARVLIVDDSVTIRRTLDLTLRRAGFSTAMARDGVEALELMETDIPRVMILDVEMPRLGGLELLDRMRGSERFAPVRVAMLTSQASPAHERRARELGAAEYLVKPCSQDTLIAVVQRLLGETETS